jgi:Haloacid Dehalogenase superfamily, subfamily IB, phosphoserine phosphatase-like
MNLVIQGEEIETPDLKELHRIARGEAIERISEDAFRVTGADPSAKAAVAARCAKARLDFGFVEEGRTLADFGLLAMDMDSTLISIECIDEIADFAGRKAEVGGGHRSAMRGEIDWPESLRRRVKALAGLEAGALERVYAERLRFNKGAEKLLAAAKRNGVRTLLVSGGFTYFTDRVREALGFDYAYSNTLVVEGGRLAGAVSGPLVERTARRARRAPEARAGHRPRARARDRRRRERPRDDGRSGDEHRVPREARGEGEGRLRARLRGPGRRAQPVPGFLGLAGVAPGQREIDVRGLGDRGLGALVPGLEVLGLVPPRGAVLTLLLHDLRILLEELVDEARGVGYVHGGFRVRCAVRHGRCPTL